MNDYKNVILIFSGYNERAIVSFLRTLKKNKIDNYFIIAKNNEDSIMKTEYKDKVIYIRSKIELDLDEIFYVISILKKKFNFKKYLLAPSTEALNRFMLQKRKVLEEHDCIIPLADKKIYEEISNKKSFSDLCKKNRISIPKEIDIKSEYLEPFVAKPRNYYEESVKKVYSPILIQNEDDFKEFIANYNKDFFYFQEFIKGQSIYLLFYFCKNGKVYKFSQENLMQQSEGKSIIAAVNSNLHESNISNKFVNLFKKLNYTGMVMVEIRINKEKYYMIEANPRFWGPSQLFVDCNCNFFEVFLKEYGFIKKKIKFSQNDKEVRYFWSDGIKQDKMKGNSPTFYANRINYDEWIESDIYNRKDTIKLFNRKEFYNE